MGISTIVELMNICMSTLNIDMLGDHKIYSLKKVHKIVV